MLRVIPNGCEVREVPPGHLVDVSLVTADSNSPSPSLIVRDLTWLESGHQPWIPLSQSDLVPSDAQIAASLRRAVAKRLRADVPVGVFLSGGVDSAIIATLAAEILKEQGSKKVNLSPLFRPIAERTETADIHRLPRQRSRFIFFARSNLCA